LGPTSTDKPKTESSWFESTLSRVGLGLIWVQIEPSWSRFMLSQVGSSLSWVELGHFAFTRIGSSTFIWVICSTELN